MRLATIFLVLLFLAGAGSCVAAQLLELKHPLFIALPVAAYSVSITSAVWIGYIRRLIESDEVRDQSSAP